MNNDEDLRVIDRILAGEEKLFADLINRYKSYAFTISLKVLQNRQEAEEAAQDTFVKAFRNLAKFNREAKFSTWLYRIAFNTAISYKRKTQYPHQSIETTYIAHAPEGEGRLEKDDKVRFLNLALQKLSEGDRTALTLFYLKEFSMDEIAEILAIPANTIKVRIHRARQRVAEELQLLLKTEAQTL